MSEIHALHSCASDCTVRLHSVILHTSTEESATLVLYNEGVDLHHLLSTTEMHRNTRLDLYLQLTAAVIFIHEEISFCHRDLKVWILNLCFGIVFWLYHRSNIFIYMSILHIFNLFMDSVSSFFTKHNLQPSNILIRTESVSEEEEGGRLRLLLSDFGYACRCDDQEDSQLEGAVGSPGFYAPEMFLSKNGYNGRLVDVWSMGVIFVEMMLGVQVSVFLNYCFGYHQSI